MTGSSLFCNECHSNSESSTELNKIGEEMKCYIQELYLKKVIDKSSTVTFRQEKDDCEVTVTFCSAADN